MIRLFTKVSGEPGPGQGLSAQCPLNAHLLVCAILCTVYDNGLASLQLARRRGRRSEGTPGAR
jgi:hypothetical protein